MNNNREAYRKKFRNYEQNLKEKLFLTSFDLMSLNISSRLIFQAYIILDFIFLLYSPLDHMYNKSKSAKANHNNKTHDTVSEIVVYFDPAD
jgi:hypothetical protein